jgi:23S rRNA (guanosine2251-2'-O)-methyltransferase
MKDCVLILENIRSVENAGSIFRTAECLGVQRIILCGTTPSPLDRFGLKRRDFSKVALGAEELVSYEICKSVSQKVEELKNTGYKIIALEQTPNSTKLSNFKTSELNRFALVVGNEVDGVSKETLDMCDGIIEIPMRGKKESLNVSVATGIALFVLL